MTGLTWNKYSVILIDQWKEIISDIWWWILSEKFVMKHLMQTQVKRTWKPHRKTSTMKYPVLDYLNLLSKISTLETCVFEKESISIIFRPVWFITVLFTQLPWKKNPCKSLLKAYFVLWSSDLNISIAFLSQLSVLKFISKYEKIMLISFAMD